MIHKTRFKNASITVFVNEGDQKRLKTFAQHELAFFNTIIEALESRTRAFPKQVAELTDSQIEQLCETFRTNQMPVKGQMPDWLEFVTSQIHKPKLVVIPECKQLMARTLFQFFREQAEILREPVNNDKLEIAYRVSPQNISKQDSQSKRHVQIPRACVKIKWDSEQDASLIYTPLTVHPLQIPGINLNEREGWQMLIIRQEPGRHIAHDTPWLAEFKYTNNQYLIKLTDSGSNRRPLF